MGFPRSWFYKYYAAVSLKLSAYLFNHTKAIKNSLPRKPEIPLFSFSPSFPVARLAILDRLVQGGCALLPPDVRWARKMSKFNSLVARKADLVTRELPEETLVYDLRTNKAYCLNETASLVWKKLNGENEPADIARLMDKESNPVPEALVWLAIEELRKNDLLETPHYLPRVADGISRRQIIRRIGFTTAIALPVVSALLIPPPVSAASCMCVNPGECLAQTSCPNTNNCNQNGVCAP